MNSYSYAYSSLHLGSHSEDEMHHTFESKFPFFGKDINTLSYIAWEREVDNLVHSSEACSLLKETGTLDSEQPQAYAANIYGNNRPPQQQYNHDLSSNKYNPSWKEYPSQKWGNQQSQHQQVYVPPQ